MATREDLGDLVAFLGEVEKTLDGIVLQVLPTFDFFTGELREDTNAAWGQTRVYLGEASRELENAVPDDEIANRLDRVALSGASRIWKLRNFRAVLVKYTSRPFEWPGVRSILQRVLGWMNTILGSLAKVLTSIDPVKEFKEGVEHLLLEG